MPRARLGSRAYGTDVFVRDRRHATTERVSLGPHGLHSFAVLPRRQQEALAELVRTLAGEGGEPAA